ncbi:MAG: hypothetical protein IJC77_02005 [Bacteroidaceae bacterium]|nr:hypothetical protein [Bacteroidaceae bacterium]
MCKRLLNFFRKDPLLKHFTDRSNQFDLTPVYIQKYDKNGCPNPKYEPVQAIASKLGCENVKNIALTGPYGSGKSSVLKTLVHDFGKAKYLNISLATLEDDTFYQGTEENSKGGKETQSKGRDGSNSKESTQEKESINHLIEYSILQQIIYKEKSHKLRQSRLKRIQNIKWGKALFVGALLVTSIIAGIVLFKPDFLMVEILCDIFSCNRIWEKIWSVLCLLYLIAVSVYIVGFVIISTYNARINKFNIKNGEIDIKENTSIFNKHLDEIIYFFEVTKYNVVIIEDLDRFETNHIFLKLREINHLLNASNSIGRRIVFIYAVRDDLFSDINRTKFFDYIVPVIPVINSSNASDKLLAALREKGIDDISEKVCKDLGLYLDDMRVIYNIVDEYIQYRGKLGEKIEQRVLLGMIVYKNYFPKDFAELHNRKGVVYKIISSKKEYAKEITLAQEKERRKLEEKCAEEIIKHQNLTGKELRSVYVMEYIKQEPMICWFYDGSDKYSITDIVNDAKLFERLRNNEYNKFGYIGRGGVILTPELKLKYEDIERSVNPEYTYLQRVNFETEIIQLLKKDIKKMNEDIERHQQMSLADLLQRYTPKAFITDIEQINDRNKLVEFLIKEGYINEFYYDYISYFYSGTFTPEDKEYIADLRIGNKKNYDYQLYKIESVIDEIPEKSYVNGGVLNITLVKYIADHAEEKKYSSKLDRVIKCIINHAEIDFVYAFYDSYPDCSILFKRLFEKWTFFDMHLYNCRDLEPDKFDALFEVYVRYIDSDLILKTNREFDRQMSNRFDWINKRIDKIGLEKIKYLTQERTIIYVSLDCKDLNSEFMSFVIEGCHFANTENNLSRIISFLNPDKVEMFKKASVTAILSLNNESLTNDLLESLPDYIGHFPESSVEEDECGLLIIVHNAPSDNDMVRTYLSKQHNKIDCLADVPEKKGKILSISSNIVSPSWENIEDFVKALEGDARNTELTLFIEQNIDSLCTKDIPQTFSEEISRELFLYFIGTNILAYSTFIKLRKMFAHQFVDVDLSDLEHARMSHLVDNKTIAFNEYNYKQICVHFENLTESFIVNNKGDFLREAKLYEISSELAEKLLVNQAFSDTEKLQVISLIRSEAKVSTRTANIICKLFVNEPFEDISESLLLKYMQQADDIELKVRLFMLYSNANEVNDDFIKKGLNSLGGEYVKIAAQEGHRPKISKAYYNKELILYLLHRNFISTYKEEENCFQINTRRNN